MWNKSMKNSKTNKKNIILNKRGLKNNKLTNRNIPIKKNAKNVENSRNRKTPQTVPTVGETKSKMKNLKKNDSENIDKLESDIKLRKKVDIKNDIQQGNDLDASSDIQLCPFDCLIFFGDLNYRLELPRLEVELMKASIGTMNRDQIDDAIEGILEYDQLNRERITGRAFQGYSEGKISFMPTFKYDKGSDE
jgi:hypothetical protein